MSFLLFFAAACPNGTLTLAEDSGTYDFTDDISSVTFTHTDYDGVTHEYTDGDVIYEDYTITFTIEYTLSAYKLSEEVNTITYTTDADAVAGKNYATNTAKISPSDEEISYSDDVTIYNVGYNYGIENEGTGTTLDSENEVLILSWSATVTAGEYELTLLTCTYGGVSRVTVRCDRK